MKAGGIKTWKELTIGVQQLARLLFKNDFSTPDLSFNVVSFCVLNLYLLGWYTTIFHCFVILKFSVVSHLKCRFTLIVGFAFKMAHYRKCQNYEIVNLIPRVFLRHTLISKPNEHPGTL